MSTPVYVVGVGMTQFGRHLERSLQSLADEALNVALTDAGAALNDIGQVFYSGVTQGALIGQTAIPGEVVLHKIGLVGLPVWNIENACASGTSAFQLAVQALRAGACDVALALGAEKMNIPDRSRALALFEGGWDVLTADENAALLLELGKGVEVPPGSESDRPYSRFMAIYAAQCRFWMKSFGTTQRQIAAVSAKNHNHSVHNPFSQYRQPFTIEEVLAAPPITYPLTLPMCSPLSDGAAAVIVCTEAGLKKLGVDRRRAIRVAATAIATATARAPDAFDQAVCRRAPMPPMSKPASALQRYPWSRCMTPARWARSWPWSTWAWCPWAAAASLPKRASFLSADGFRSIRRAGWSARGTPSAPLDSGRSTSSSRNCVVRPVPGRWRAQRSPCRRMAAAPSVTRRPWSRSTCSRADYLLRSPSSMGGYAKT